MIKKNNKTLNNESDKQVMSNKQSKKASTAGAMSQNLTYYQKN